MSRFPFIGAARVVVVAAAGAGIVLAAQHDPRSLDLRSRPTAAQAGPTSREVPLQQRMLPCAGQELTGTAGVPDVELTGRITAVAPPPQVLQGLSVPRESAASGTAALPPVLSIAVAGAPGSGTARSVSALTPAASPLPTGAQPVVVSGAGALAPGLTAGQEWRSDTDTLRGLAGTACVTPATQQWLIAGGGAAGRQERIVLSNPGANEVTVDITIIGAKGPVEDGADRGVVVPGHGRVAVLVDALAGSEPTPIVQLRTSGGTIAATLTDTWLDGAVPLGAESVGPAAPPATMQVIPLTRRLQSGSVRIGVPGDTQAVISARLLTTKGPVPLGDGGVHRVQGHSVLELPLPHSAQVEAIEIRSDVPVVAAALSRVGGEGKVGEFAWSAGANALEGLGGLAFPAGEDSPNRTLGLVASTGTVTAEVTTLASGKVVTVRVPVGADSLVLRGLGHPDAVWVRRVEGPGALRVGVLSETGEGAERMLSMREMRDLPLTSMATTAVPLP